MAAGLGGASAAMAAPVVVIPVACSVTSLHNAINFAPSDAILSLKSGCVYSLTGSLPTVRRNLVIQGNGDVIARRSGTFTALTVNRAQLSINQLTMADFRGGTINPGALNNNGGTVVITKSSFADNDGGLGGAIQNDHSGNLSVTSTNFVDNDAFFGGAVYNRDDSVAWFSTDEFAGNEAESGGAIFNSSGHVTVTGYSSSISGSSNFAGNEATGALVVPTVKGSAIPAIPATGDGGAIDNTDGTLTVTFSNFTDNSATGASDLGTVKGSVRPDAPPVSGDGGAVWNGGGASTIGASGFTANFARDDGGAIATTKSLSLASDTVSRNRANDDGGGIFVNGGTTSLNKTFVTGNSAGGTGGGIRRNSGSVSLTNGSLVQLNHPNNCSGFFC